MDEKKRYSDIDSLLRGAISANDDLKSTPFPLNQLFEQRLHTLDITKNQAVKILDVEVKTLDPILNGEARKIDFLTILKLSDFLEIPHNEIIKNYFQVVSDAHNDNLSKSKVRSFIVNNFNLPSLKKIGFIESINDFEHIEQKLLSFFGYNDIFEYAKYKVSPAFSSSKRNSNRDNLTFWVASAYESFKMTPNNNAYNRQALVDYFPTIRWHSMNVENGLWLVAQALFKFGVTLVYIPKFTTDLHVRGATFSYDDKPCIALTKYTEYYPTIWFALIHELYHVLFDFDKIREDKYHISGEMETMNINEEEANKFAREYLFSDEKMAAVRPHLNNPGFVKVFAEQNHVHPSFIYVFNAFDSTGGQNKYAKLKPHLPNFSGLLENFNAKNWEEFPPIKQISKIRTSKLSK